MMGAMSRSTIETTTILIGAAFAMTARFGKLPWLFLPAMALLMVGFTIKFGKFVRRPQRGPRSRHVQR